MCPSFFYIINKMKLFFPNNVFSRLTAKNLPDNIRSSVEFLPSPLLTTRLREIPDSVALIPTMDLIKNGDLFVSKSFGISFEGTLCNSYFFYGSSRKEISTLNLFGDVSAVEVVMCKLLFKELYDSEIELAVITDESKIKAGNTLVVGDKNFGSGIFSEGISFSEEIIETLNLPFVNYVLASGEEAAVKLLNRAFEGIGNKIYDNAEEFLSSENLGRNVSEYIAENISSFIPEFDVQDAEGIEQILRLPYFHGMIDDIVEVKFV